MPAFFWLCILAVATASAPVFCADHAPSTLDDAALPRRVMEGGIRLEKLLDALGLNKDEGIRIETREPSAYPKEHVPPGNFYKQAFLKWESETEILELAKAFAAVGGGEEAVARKLRAVAREGKKEIALTEILPPFVRARVGTCTGEYGPNCWNAVLNFHYPDFGVRGTPGNEMQAKLDKDFQPLPKQASVRPGDVICVYNQIWGEAARVARTALNIQEWASPLRAADGIMHCGVYLGGGVVFQKHNTYENEPYVFDSFEHAFDSYQAVRERLIFRIYRRKD